MIETGTDFYSSIGPINLLNEYASRTVGLILSVYQEGKLVRNFIHGKIYKNSEVTISNDILVHLGSNTKAFTSALILLAHLDSKLNLSDSVSSWFSLGNFKIDPKITIRHLLKHESGLMRDIPKEYWSEVYRADFKIDNFLDRHGQLLLNPSTDRSDKYHYSNLGYALLGHILEKAYQKSFKEILSDLLFSTLGIDAFILGDESKQLSDECLLTRTWPHVKSDDQLIAIDPKIERSDNPRLYQSASNLLLSHNNWIKFFGIYKDRRFQSVQNIIKRDLLNPHFENYSIGGWFVKTHPLHGEIWSHSGANGGNSSFARCYKDHDTILLVNFNSHDDDLMSNLVELMDSEIREKILGK